MTAVKSTDMELNVSEYDFWVEEKLSNRLAKDDLMDTGTFVNTLSDSRSLLDEEIKGLDLFLCDSPSLTNGENFLPTFSLFVAAPHNDILNNSSNTGFSPDDYIPDDPSLVLVQPLPSDKNLFSDHDMECLPSLECNSSYELLMSSPLSSYDLDSVLSNSSDEFPTEETPQSPHIYSGAVTCDPDNNSVSSIPSLAVKSENDCCSESSSLFSPIYLTPPGLDSDSTGVCSPYSSTSRTSSSASSRSSSPCQLEKRTTGKAKRSKSYRTKENPYSLDKSTGPISPPPSPHGNLGLSKKDKKKIQNKNAAIRYRQKMKEEALHKKDEEDELIIRNTKLKSKVEDLQKEIQYMKNLMKEVNRAKAHH